MNAIDYLQKALSSLPAENNSLQEVRYHVRIALMKLRQKEKSQVSREATIFQSWHDMLKNGITNPYTPKRTVDVINGMIEQEKHKLDELLDTKKVNLDDAKEETLLG